MKKTYEAPSVEKIAFMYRDQVVAASYPSGTCVGHWKNNASNVINECFTGYTGDLTGHN